MDIDLGRPVCSKSYNLPGILDLASSVTELLPDSYIKDDTKY